MSNHRTRIKSWLIIDFIGLLIILLLLGLATLYLRQEIKPKSTSNYYAEFIKRYNPHLSTADVNTIIYEVNLCAIMSGIDIRIIYAIPANESGFNPEAISPDGKDQGMWQQHAPQWGPASFSITKDTRMACQILIYEKVKAHGDIFLTLRRYNSAKGGSAYAKKILQLARTIE